MKMDSRGGHLFLLRWFINFSPLYLTQDIINHAAAGNLKAKTIACNEFSRLGNSGFVGVERLCWHPREASELGTVQLGQHSSSHVHPIMPRQLLFRALLHNMADTSYQINKKNLRHILCLCFDYNSFKQQFFLSVWKIFCTSWILSSTSIFDRRPSCEIFKFFVCSFWLYILLSY